MNTEFRIETVKQIKDDIKELIEEHYQEVALYKDKVKLDPDWNSYQNLQDKQMLLIISVRDNKKLVGYAVFYLYPHPHYKMTKVGSNDILYLKKGYRGQGIWQDLKDYSERILKVLKTDVINWHVKPEFDFSPYLERNGYRLHDKVYSKFIGTK